MKLYHQIDYSFVSYNFSFFQKGTLISYEMDLNIS